MFPTFISAVHINLTVEGLHCFFYQEDPAQWTPTCFASHPQATDFMDYIRSLHRIKNGGVPSLKKYCAKIVEYLQEDASGRNEERRAKQTIRLRNAMYDEKEEELILKSNTSINFLKRRSDQESKIELETSRRIKTRFRPAGDGIIVVDKGITSLSPDNGKGCSTDQIDDTDDAEYLGEIAGEEYHNDSNEALSSTRFESPASEAATHVGEEPPWENDVDVVSLAEISTEGIDKVFNVEPFVFTGCLSDIDIGADFTMYFKECAALKYNRATIPDFLALFGVLLMRKEPTFQQQRFFGEKYKTILTAMKGHVLEPEDELIDEGLATVRKWKDVYNKTLRKTDDTRQARDALEEAVDGSKKSPLKKLFLHGCSNFSSTRGSPVSEADQTSCFILPMLSCIMNKPDQSRLAHTATTPTTGSLFVRLCKDLDAPPKHPDLIVKHKETIDISFGEVSYKKDFSKDQGDLCRLAIWSKRALDHLQVEYQGLEDLDLFFFHIVSTKCTIYQMRRFGTICIGIEIGELDIVQDLVGLIAFEDQVFVWLSLEKTFTRLLKLMEAAEKRVDMSTLPPCYHGLSTPSARKMP